MYYYLILIIVILIIFFCFQNISKQNEPVKEEFINLNKSSWNLYRQKPLGYIKTGKTPMNYYVKIRYRKPYRFPFTYKKTYPYKHDSFLP